MPNAKEHHYVPQFYFRNFSHCENKRTINLLLKSNGKIVPNASIRGQSKRRNLYVDSVIEDALSGVEGAIAICFRELIDGCMEFGRLRQVEQIHYYAATSFSLQPLRIPQRAETWHTATTYLREIAATVLADGDDKSFDDYRRDVLTAVHVALIAPILFFDLSFALIVNATDRPFIFSDAPAISTNRLLWERREISGITGLGSRGLIALMPISEQLAYMFFDGGAYCCRQDINQPVCLNSVADVGLLNAFQIHSGNDSIYFGDLNEREYVERLLKAHRPNETRNRMISRSAYSADGKSELVHNFEMPIPVTPDFSFLELRRSAVDDDFRLPRNERLMNAVEQTCQASNSFDETFTQERFEMQISKLFREVSALRDRV